MATNKGLFEDRTRTYHRTPATSAPGYSVIDIIDQAYRRLNEPSVKLNTSMASDRIESGVFALRGLLDSINADPTIRQPAEYVSYDVPIQPTITWGLGGWDINDQPPLEIHSLWFNDRTFGRQFGRRGQLTEMSMADLARFRDSFFDEDFDLREPTRYFFEKTWPVRRLHFDYNIGRGNDDLTFRPDAITTINWRTTDQARGIVQGSGGVLSRIERFVQGSLISVVLWSTRDLGPDPVLNFLDDDAALNPVRPNFVTLEPDPTGTTRDLHYRYQFFVRQTPDPTLRLVGEPTTSRVEILVSGGGAPISTPPADQRRGFLNGFVVKAFALPEDSNAVLNFTLNMPPGYFEYILCGLAIRLSSLSSKPLPQAILFAFNQAKFGLTSRAEGFENDTDLGFITPNTRYVRNIDSL